MTNGEDLVEITAPLSASLSADNSELSQFSIPEGRYLPSEIAGRIQSSLNSSANLSTVGASVSVSVSNGILELSSSRFGTGSRIELANIVGGGQIGVNAQSNNGENMDGVIKTSDGDLLLLGYVDPKDGRKVTISDYSVTDTGPAPVRGLSFSVLGGDLGARGDISFSQGFASRLESTINSFFEDGGLLVSRLDAIAQKEKQFEDKEKQLDTRYDRILTRYQLQFSALQSILSSTEQTKSYLSSAFGNNS
jgi:flagellar hook-associated protein 2